MCPILNLESMFLCGAGYKHYIVQSGLLEQLRIHNTFLQWLPPFLEACMPRPIFLSEKHFNSDSPNDFRKIFIKLIKYFGFFLPLDILIITSAMFLPAWQNYSSYSLQTLKKIKVCKIPTSFEGPHQWFSKP